MKFLLVIILVSLPAVFVKGHEICIDYESPKAAALAFCTSYTNSSCCSSSEDTEVETSFNSMLASGSWNDFPTCATFVKSAVCAVCDPWAAHLFDAEHGNVRESVIMCDEFCNDYYEACKNVPFKSGTIVSQYPTSIQFCAANTVKNTIYCHPFVQKDLATTSSNLIDAFPNLKFPQILDLKAPKGSNLLYALDKKGKIYVFENHPNTSEYSVFLDIESKVAWGSSGNEQGLLGLALHPNFKNNKVFFVYYTAVGTYALNISKYLATNEKQADITSEKVLISIPHPRSNHNGGWIDFGPDGFLYLGIGDGGGSGDPDKNGQDLGELLGKILRIDVDGTEEPYGIPADNPFVGVEGAKKEIWAYGMRNPWRCSFDAANGQLWCADVGQNKIEEIDIIEKGKNYGWNHMEGTLDYSCNNCNKTSLVPPIFEYLHDGVNVAKLAHITIKGNSITGGFVYRSSSVPSLQGKYIFADYTSKIVVALQREGNGWKEVVIGQTSDGVAGFGVDNKQELYIFPFAGDRKLRPILKFAPTIEIDDDTAGEGTDTTTIDVIATSTSTNTITTNDGTANSKPTIVSKTTFTSKEGTTVDSDMTTIDYSTTTINGDSHTIGTESTGETNTNSDEEFSQASSNSNRWNEAAVVYAIFCSIQFLFCSFV